MRQPLTVYRFIKIKNKFLKMGIDPNGVFATRLWMKKYDTKVPLRKVDVDAEIDFL